MTVPFFIEEPFTHKQVEVPQDILYYCDTTTFDADREHLRYLDCVWMHMGYYGTPAKVMEQFRNESIPPIAPVFE